ncbi:hypothetical protein [Rhodoferax aquaticus]|uniref:Uncharacterized protein n=1 Tax=Rhodoferax aquaticus TaxID=2527691 RepID=A0A515EQS8_9BURK|nr:hypothetical protein [Rhodoferax aquaticus]QDL55000.1 hypothetical protein EXZ61_12960 [Rhodoferax aquaticus]
MEPIALRREAPPNDPDDDVPNSINKAKVYESEMLALALNKGHGFNDRPNAARVTAAQSARARGAIEIASRLDAITCAIEEREEYEAFIPAVKPSKRAVRAL